MKPRYTARSAFQKFVNNLDFHFFLLNLFISLKAKLYIIGAFLGHAKATQRGGDMALYNSNLS